MKQAIALCLFAFSSCTVLPGMDWNPVNPADLALKTPRVDPGADAEALSWDEWVADAAANNEYPYTTYSHYIRIKVFNDRGVKRFGTVDLEYRGKQNITDVAARTIHPDGSIQEMGHDAIFTRVIEKTKRQKVRAVSFAIPGITPGSIIEYRWRVSDQDTLANYVPLFACRDIPVEHFTLHLKPLQTPYFPYAMRYQQFHVNLPPFKVENGWDISHLENLPAMQEEEDSPPSSEICPWILIYYAEDRKETLDHFWKTEGKHRWATYRENIKVNGAIKDLAQEITGNAKSPEDKLQRLTIYCRKKLKDLASPETSDLDRQGFKPNKNSVDTLNRGIGTTADIKLAFAALADAAGFEARPAFLCDRETMLFHPEYMIPMLNRMDIAVNVNGKWRLYDVTSKYVEPGHLRWQEEGVKVLIADDKDPEWVLSDFTPADSSQSKHQGQIKLDEAGTLSGTLQDTLTGHPAEEWRETYSNLSEVDRNKRLTELVARRFPGAEVTDMKSSDPGDVTKSVSIQYQISMTGYATRTGKRLFFAPAIAEYNEPARYTASSRKYNVMYRYPWSEVEDISIKTPPGYDLDHADAPRPLSLGEVGGYSVRIMKLPDRLYYHREFTFGKNGAFYFETTAYPTLKQAFDAIHDNDTHLLTLKVQPPAGTAPAAP